TLAPEDRRRGVHVGDVVEDRGVERDVLEGLAGAVQRQFAFCGAVGVIERGGRGAPLRDLAQILDRQRRVQPPRLRVEFRLLELQQFEDLGGFGKLPLYHCGLASSGREKCGHRSVVRSVPTTLRERRQRRITSSLRVWSGSAPFAPMT